MKRLLLPICTAALLLGCASTNSTSPQATLLSDSLTYPESVLSWGNQLLVTNFGTEQLNPLNAEGKGYVVSYSDNTTRVIIPTDGNLSAPKGTFVKDSTLFIADVGKVVIYDLSSPTPEARIVAMPEGELFVNDLDALSSTLFITVTNTGNIYSLDISDPTTCDSTHLSLYTQLDGANGILVVDSTIYLASYPSDGITKAENTIYVIAQASDPTPVPLIERAGQYDGLLMNASRTKLYFTNWVNAEVGAIDLATGEVTLLEGGVAFSGPARLDGKGSTLFIPDLPNSRVVAFEVEDEF